MKAVGLFIQTKPVEIVKEHSSGIILTGVTKTILYEVVSVGDGVKEVVVGDRLILAESYKGEEVTIDGEKYYFMPYEIVLGVF